MTSSVNQHFGLNSWLNIKYEMKSSIDHFIFFIKHFQLIAFGIGSNQIYIWNVAMNIFFSFFMFFFLAADKMKWRVQLNISILLVFSSSRRNEMSWSKVQVSIRGTRPKVKLRINRSSSSSSVSVTPNPPNHSDYSNWTDWPNLFFFPVRAVVWVEKHWPRVALPNLT
jgi:hypothetical protein